MSKKAPKPYGWVRMSYNFSSGVFHLGSECPPGWAGGAVAVYSEQPAQEDPCPGCRKGGVCRTPKCGRLKLPVDHPFRSEQPAQQQEPAAWNVINPAGQVVATEKDAIYGWARLGGFKPTLEGFLGFHDQGWRVVPASPPASKPLTDEEIKRMAAPLFMSHYWNLCNDFARAIEAAHGIKEHP